MPNHIRLLVLLCFCGTWSVACRAEQVPWTSSQDQLGIAMDEARAELLVRKSWAKNIPPVAEARRKGNTLLIGIGNATSTQWKAWWEQTLCEAPELRKVLSLNGGVKVFAESESDSVFYNKASCEKRNTGRSSSDPITSEPYTVAPTRHAEPSKPCGDDPIGLVASLAKANEVVVENQLRTAERPETAARIAVFKKNLYGALLKEGFTKTEAISIVNSTPIPSLWK